MSAISDNMQNLLKGSSVIRLMFEEGKRLAEEYGKENVYDFSLGNPSVPAPPEFNEAIKEVLRENDSLSLHGYMNNAGFEETRAAVAADLNKRFGANYSASHIIMTVGAAGALVAAMKVLINPGDEVVVIAPYFLEYGNYIADFGGVVKVVPPNPPAFIPEAAKIAEAITEKTKAVIVNNPNNPTGVVYGKEFIEDLAGTLEAARERYAHSIYLITDEPYRELVYDGAEVPFAASYYKNSLMAYSFSKSMSIPGERIGYIAVSPDADECADICQSLAIAVRVTGAVNAPSLQQKAIVKVLDKLTDVSVYDENRKLLCEGIEEAGFEYVKPEGAFYLFVKTPIADDNEFSEHAKNKYRILVSPGSAFCCPGYVRIAYCVAKETIERAIPYFKQLARDYGTDVD